MTETLNFESILLSGIESKRPLIMAGPCSAETEEQVLETAKGLAAQGIKIFRAGIWKPRTKPGGFEGVGTEGLAWLKKVKETTGMYTATEVANQHHVFEALKHGIDILDWCTHHGNPFAAKLPMLLKADILFQLKIRLILTRPWTGNKEFIMLTSSNRGNTSRIQFL
ncbi:MAG: hypothetical protein ACLTTW_03810 [Coprobacter sp.]